MGLYQWNYKRYTVGDARIDAQHQHLFSLLNTLYAAMKEKQASAVIDQTLDALLEYTQVHFSDEEAYMEELGYPELPEHHHQHLKLTAAVKAMRNKNKGVEKIATFELLNFLGYWVVDHVLSSDRQIGSFIEKRNKQ